MRQLLTMGLMLALAGCGDEEPVKNVSPVAKPAAKTMLGGVDLDQPVLAWGTGLSWSMRIAPGSIYFSPVPGGEHSTDFYPVSPKLDDGRAVFTTKTPQAEPVTIILTSEPCAAGKETLPLTVETRIGARMLRGCAGPEPRVPRPVASAPEGNATDGNAAVAK